MVWLVTAAWRRYDVTRLCLAQWAHLRGELAGRGIHLNAVVVADDQNLDTAAEHGFDTVEQNNTWLGRKFNDGLEHACRNGAEYVVLIGSDDWIHESMFDRLPLPAAVLPEIGPDRPVVVGRSAAEIITGRRIGMVNLETGRLLRCVSHGRYGVIPWIIHRRALEPSGFRPVNEQLERGVDGSLIAGLRMRPMWVFTDPHELCRVDFKSAVNLTSYRKVKRTPRVPQIEETDPWTPLAELYPAHLVDQARTVAAEHMTVAA